MELPADATIDWAMFFHTFRGETNTAFRAKMSERAAKAFRQRVSATGTIYDNFDTHLLTPDDKGFDAKPQVDAAFAMEQASVDVIVFCKPENDEVPIYFWISGWPERDIHSVDTVFFPAKQNGS